MKIGILEKINSNHKRLRTTKMEGIFQDFPKEGETFSIWGKGIEFGNRMIETSKVVEIIEDIKDGDNINTEYMLFQTENSKYRVTLLEELEDKSTLKYLEDNVTIPDSSAGVQ